MRNDNFTRSVLTLIALSLVVLASENWKHDPSVVRAATGASGRQQYEYKTIFRNFSYKDGEYSAVQSWSEDSDNLPDPGENAGAAMRAKINELGSRGWELVSVTPYSFDARMSFAAGQALGFPIAIGQANGVSGYTWGGTTTGERWIFKRAKP